MAKCHRETLVPCRDVVVSSASQHLYCADDFGSVFEQEVSTGARTPRLFDRQTGVTGPLALTVDQHELLASSYSNDAVALWKLDGGGPIQRVIASESGSVATFGYNSTGTVLNSSEGLYDPSLWDPVTGEMTDALDSVVIGTWADAPDRFWAAFVEPDDSPLGYRFTGGLYDTTTKARVPGVRIEFGDDVLAVPWNDAAHQRMFVLAGDNVRVFDQLGNYIGPTIAVDQPGTRIQTVQSSADGTKVVISVNGQTSLYDAATGAKLDVPPLPLMASVVSPNGVAVGSTIEGDLWIFDPDTLEKLDELPGLHGYAELLTLNADGTTLAAENESDGIRIYDVPSRTQIGENIPDVDGALGFRDAAGWQGARCPVRQPRTGLMGPRSGALGGRGMCARRSEPHPGRVGQVPQCIRRLPRELRRRPRQSVAVGSVVARPAVLDTSSGCSVAEPAASGPS